MAWFVLYAFLWPAPVELWDVVTQDPDPVLQQKLINRAAKGEPGHWVHDA